jgi:hypothetical protein
MRVINLRPQARDQCGAVFVGVAADPVFNQTPHAGRLRAGGAVEVSEICFVRGHGAVEVRFDVVKDRHQIRPADT